MLRRFFDKFVTKMEKDLPLVVILGATGCGKTKLSLELAQKFNGEVVGADSMQIYKGLDILTAKATLAERNLVPHYLVNELEPNEECNAYTYRNKALEKIEEIFSRGKLPIVVGGTNYYIESLLFKILVDGTNLPENKQVVRLLEEKSTQELHEMLKNIDPERAQRLHPQDKRKIVRSLEVFKLLGRKHSDILKEQIQQDGGSPWGGGLRFQKSVVLWLECNQAVLDKRLDERVDSMLKEGLVEELLDFHIRYNQQRLKKNETADYTKGIFQSIGLKDFHNFLLLKSDAEREENAKMFDEAVKQLKAATRRYARKQKKWIVNRLLSNGENREVPPVFSLDTTEVDQWSDKVGLPAQEIVRSYLDDRFVCRYPALPKRETNASPLAYSESHFCEPCQRLFIGNQWLIHKKSHVHKRVLARKAKRAKLENAEG